MRSDLAVLTDAAAGDLRVLLSKVKTADAAKQMLVNELPALITTYGLASGTVAADWYDDLRDRERIDRRFRSIVAELPADLGAAELAGWGLSPVFKATPDWKSATELVSGGLQRRILNQARKTITGSSVADPSAGGWQRVGNGACAFCRMLIGRGAVYSKYSKDFAAHDNCRCTAQPAFNGKEIPVKPFTPSEKNIPQADKDRAKQWIADNL